MNGEKVIDITEAGLYIGKPENTEDYSRAFIDELEIKSIATHEQFKGIEYKVVE